MKWSNPCEINDLSQRKKKAYYSAIPQSELAIPKKAYYSARKE
jgi:hypothetical protein